MTHGKKLLYFSSRSAKLSTLVPSHSSHHKARWRSPSRQLTTPLPTSPTPSQAGQLHTGHTQPPWLPANHCPQRWGGGQSLPTETGVVANHCPQRWVGGQSLPTEIGVVANHCPQRQGWWPITAHRDRGGGQSLPRDKGWPIRAHRQGRGALTERNQHCQVYSLSWDGKVGSDGKRVERKWSLPGACGISRGGGGVMSCTPLKVHRPAVCRTLLGWG